MIFLVPLTPLSSLNLAHCVGLTGEGMSQLAPITALTSLNLKGLDILSDKGVRALALLTGLTWSYRTFSSFWKQRLSVTLVQRLVCVILLCARVEFTVV
jgi:UDP-N-acetylmuramate-alanine ligase